MAKEKKSKNELPEVGDNDGMPVFEKPDLEKATTVRLSLVTDYLIDLLAAQTRSGNPRKFANNYLNGFMCRMFKDLTGDWPKPPKFPASEKSIDEFDANT